MSSRAKNKRRRDERRRMRKEREAGEPQAQASAPVEAVHIATVEVVKTCPTAEQMRHATYRAPEKTKGASAGPYINQDEDMIGRLYREGNLSYSQEAAARLFQDVRAAWVEELGTAGYRSCLAEGVAGYDSGDGNVEAVRAYRAMRDKIGAVECAFLESECAKDGQGKPRDLRMLKAYLGRIAA